jgi:hypothetical protein
MVINTAALQQLREAGVKRADFTADGELQSVEFFAEASASPAAEDVEKALAGETEVPGGFVHAASVLLSKNQAVKS